jgi:hypothetical protein
VLLTFFLLKHRGESGTSDDEEKPPKIFNGKSQFWSDMEPYFAPFTNEDLKFIATKTIDENDPAFVIPPKGKHYFDAWEQEDTSNFYGKTRPRQSLSSVFEQQSTVRKEEPAVEAPMFSNDSIQCGELTSRILSALIEQKVVPEYLKELTDFYSTSIT